MGSQEELARAIAKYAKAEPDPNVVIGCVLLRDLFFVGNHDALDAPDDFAKNIVRFKRYDLGAAGSRIDLIFDSMLTRAEFKISDERDGHPLLVPGPVFGRERFIPDRVGQQAFKGLVLASYNRRCAVTGNHIRPTLEAAHIRPVSLDGPNRVDNGLLLRSDVHTLFDLGYLGLS